MGLIGHVPLHKGNLSYQATFPWQKTQLYKRGNTVFPSPILVKSSIPRLVTQNTQTSVAFLLDRTITSKQILHTKETYGLLYKLHNDLNLYHS